MHPWMSLEVENMFTNVPEKEMIKIVLDNVYDHNEMTQSKIPCNLRQRIFLTCTEETPFVPLQEKCIYRKMAAQWDYAWHQPWPSCTCAP